MPIEIGDTKMCQPFVLLRLTQGLAIFSALVSFCLFAAKPDIERYLTQNVPGTSMPDAFNGLNDSIPTFLLFVTGTLLLLARINRKRQYVLLLPLLFGPFACFVGWYLTENLSDPNWFDLFATTTIGMRVSCAVTALLSIASKKTTKPIDAHKAIDEPF